MKDTAQIRKEIDAVDDQIADLYVRRMALAAEIAEVKRAAGQPVTNPAREREIISRMTERVGPELEDGAAMIFSTLFGIARARQRKLIGGPTRLEREITEAVARTPAEFPTHATVACQGTDGAYSQQAVTSLFKFPSILFFNTFDGVFSAVEKGMCRYGVLPIENSSAGSVTAVYDQMVKHNFRVVRATRLHVPHVLLAARGVKLADIKEITSHPQALAQCSIFLHDHPDIRQVPSTNTAVAARNLAASGRKDLAVIASRTCAEIYDLDVLDDNIGDTQANFTRFICISKDLEIYPDAGKISVMMSLPHRPGSLGNVLAKFSAIGVNLTKLESRPIPGMDFEFRFTFDFEAKPSNANAVRLLAELSEDPEIQHFTFLGSYAEN